MQNDKMQTHIDSLDGKIYQKVLDSITSHLSQQKPDHDQMNKITERLDQLEKQQTDYTKMKDQYDQKLSDLETKLEQLKKIKPPRVVGRTKSNESTKLTPEIISEEKVEDTPRSDQFKKPTKS